MKFLAEMIDISDLLYISVKFLWVIAVYTVC